MMKHSEEKKHHVSLNPAQGVIWCHSCEDDLDSQADILKLGYKENEDFTEDEKKEIEKSLKKMEEFTETIKESMGEFLQKKTAQRQQEGNMTPNNNERGRMDIEEDSQSTQQKMMAQTRMQ